MDPRIALVLDPRFPGGTSSAVAQELPILDRLGRVDVHGISSAMFKDTPVNPALNRALGDAGHHIIWDKPVISANLIVLHNPSFLKFDKALTSKLSCQNLIVVTHENFLTPMGGPGFDVAGCLERISTASLCAGRYLAPVSRYNRQTVERWLDGSTDWELTQDNWFNICDFELVAPNGAPRDRRGRHSRPGTEKFPNFETMSMLFPAHAEHNAILGADRLALKSQPGHWNLYNFRTMAVAQFLDEIDFFVYFTHPNLRESFGRVLAEATAAGKLVITDPDTAANFGDGIVGAHPDEVDAHIARFVADPALYVETVKRAQQTLTSYSSDKFADQVRRMLSAFGYTPQEAS